MSQFVTVQYGPYHGDKQNVPVTPNKLLREVLEHVCSKQGWDATCCALVYKKVELDLSLSIRFANLAPGAKLDLVRYNNGIKASVNIALQLEDGQRLVSKIDNATSMWAMLEQFEQLVSQPGIFTQRTFQAKGQAEPALLTPVCVVMNKEYAGREQLEKQTLSSIGLVSGSGMVRLSFRDGQKSVAIGSLGPLVASAAPATQSAPLASSSSTAAPSATTSADMEVDATPATASESDTASASSSATASSAEPMVNIEKELQQHASDVRLFKPSETFQDLTKLEIPDEFYEVTEDDVRKMAASLKQKEEPLMTKAMRERAQRKALERRPRTLLRIRFPDRYVLQATFGSSVKVQEVYDWVASASKSQAEFYLFTTPPKVVLSNRQITLFEAQLTPFSMVNYALKDGSKVDTTAILKDELLATAEDLPHPVIPQATIEESDLQKKADQSASSSTAESSSAASTATSGLKIPKWLKLHK